MAGIEEDTAGSRVACEPEREERCEMRRELCQNYNFNPPSCSLHFLSPSFDFPSSSLPHPASIPLPFSLLLLPPFHSPFSPSISLSLPLSRSVPPSPLLSTSCSAEISAEAPVRLSGDRDGGSDITAPSTDCQPSAVAMATSATACGAEAGDETPAEGGRGEEGECVRILFFFSCLRRVVCACLCSLLSVVAS